VDHLLLQVEVFFFDVCQETWVLNFIRVNVSLVLTLNILIVLLIVPDVFILEFFDDTLEVGPLLTVYVLIRQGLLGDISIVEVHANMLVLHVKVSSDRRVGDDFLELFTLSALLDFVAVEHRDLGDILERRLEATPNHDILLDELHVARVFTLRQFFFLTDRNWILAFMHAFLLLNFAQAARAHIHTFVRDVVFALPGYQRQGHLRLKLVLHPEGLLAHVVAELGLVSESSVGLGKFAPFQCF